MLDQHFYHYVRLHSHTSKSLLRYLINVSLFLTSVLAAFIKLVFKSKIIQI